MHGAARNYHIGKVTFALKSTRRASPVGLASWLSAGLTEGSEERGSGDAMRGEPWQVCRVIQAGTELHLGAEVDR